MSDLSTPIVVAEGWDIILFKTVADAESYLEPIDVINGIFDGYDAEGRLLKFETNVNEVRIYAAEEEPAHSGELERLLRGFLNQIEDPTGANFDCDLPCLVAACDRFVYESPQNFRVVLLQFFRDFFRGLLGRDFSRRS